MRLTVVKEKLRARLSSSKKENKIESEKQKQESYFLHLPS